MQNKGFIRVFAVLLALICIFYLSFSFVTNKYNKEAAAYANGDADKEVYYLDSLANKQVWLGYTLKQCRENEITLGLDLKGGMNVILELNVADVIRSLSNNNKDEKFNQALEAAKSRQSVSQRGFIDLFVEEFRKADPGARLSAIFGNIEMKEKITSNSTDEEVITVLKSELASAIDNSFNVLRTRIDRFGVVSPNIQRLETDGRILVELPGVKEPERVRKLLQGSANLEFWETYDLQELYQALSEADAVLARMLEDEAATATDSVTTETSATTDENLLAEAEAKPDQSDDSAETSELDSLLNLNQVNAQNQETAQSEAQFAKEHPLFALLIPNSYNGQLVPGPVVGVASRQDMNKIDSFLNMRQVREVLPNDALFRWAVKSRDENEQYFELYALKSTNRDNMPAMNGDVVTDATADFSQGGLVRTEQEVSMTMNAEGAKLWARLTKENVGRCVAIVLDNLVYSAPRVNEEITGGQSRISGQFSVEEAKDLANVLKSGKMSAPARIISEEMIGPSLGQASINSGLLALLGALIVLMLYLIVVYGWRPGLIANSALLLNLFFTMGVMVSFHAVLTLSGIAGIVLALAIAVDANVLIYERIKEEIRGGKVVKKAVEEGYKKAFSAIFDSNLTSIITGVILLWFGTGPIKGFATTLIIGIFISFGTSVFLTRVIYETLMAKGKLLDLTFTTPLTKNFLVNPAYNLMRNRKLIYTVTGIIVAVCAVFIFARGLNSGIDFTGGRNYKVQFEQPINPEEVRSLVENKFGEDVNISVIAIGTDNKTVRISTNYRIEENSNTVDAEIESTLYEALKPLLTQNISLETFVDRENYTGGSIISSQKVGPSIAEDIKTGAVWSVIFAVIAIGLYILFRFRNISYSIGASVALAGDVLFVIGAYAILWGFVPFSLEVDQTFIGAILTVIGYSINDKVVIFDRVREYTNLYPKRPKYELFNEALNSTLDRTFNTSMSTIVVLLVIFIFAGDSIRSFSFAMLLGVIVGTFSSLFTAAPIACQLQERSQKKTAKAELKK